MPFSGPALKILPSLVEDPVRVLLGGLEYPGAWFDVDMDSDVFTPADGFEMTARVPAKGGLLKGGLTLSAFREGVTLDLYVGDDRQMAGVIDDVDIYEDKGVRLKIVGRDKGAFLVDNETKSLRFSDYTLKSLAEAMILPEWGIRKVVISNEDNRRVLFGKHEKQRFQAGKVKVDATGRETRKQTKIDPGQKIAAILDEHCHRAGVTWWITAQGDLFIGKPQYDQQPRFEFFSYAPTSSDARRNNIGPGWRVKRSIHDRYSEITCVGQSEQDASKEDNIFDPMTTAGSRTKKYRGTAYDSDLRSRGITRKLILADSDALSDKMCQEKAQEEMERRRRNALVLTFSVPGFKQNGTLFAIDSLAKVVIEEAEIDDVFWIGQRRFVEKKERRYTELTLFPKGVYLP